MAAGWSWILNRMPCFERAWLSKSNSNTPNRTVRDCGPPAPGLVALIMPPLHRAVYTSLLCVRPDKFELPTFWISVRRSGVLAVPQTGTSIYRVFICTCRSSRVCLSPRRLPRRNKCHLLHRSQTKDARRAKVLWWRSPRLPAQPGPRIPTEEEVAARPSLVCSRKSLKRSACLQRPPEVTTTEARAVPTCSEANEVSRCIRCQGDVGMGMRSIPSHPGRLMRNFTQMPNRER